MNSIKMIGYSKLLVAFFIIGFILALYKNNLLAGQTEEAKMFKQLKEMEKEEKSDNEAAKYAITRPIIKYGAYNLKNPFQDSFIREETVTAESPKVSKIVEKALPVFTIQGLIWGGSLPQAIINNKVVKVGEFIEGAEVIDINKKGVSLFFEGKQYELSSRKTASTIEP